ncbi:MBL fold metallo-hydrolase [Mangrovimonas sp. TPBH4]|uniref:MBL fold metallo-hydrolase n=1 Tax=Mangrovimonas sp. TPBH4 TaxID=1645914 RepID=UPI0006B64B11|nr:MBL fold metallo-hydrolase [Mangrovimonas sp. TPBH4]
MTKAKHIIALVVCFAFSLLEAFAQDIKTFQVADNLYFVGDRTFSCFYITEASVIVIDPLDSTRAQATLAAIKKVTNKPISTVFYSHNHWDHISGGKVFQNTDTKFISHIEAKNNIAPNNAVITPTETWQGNTTSYDFENGQVLELFYFGPNHGAGMTVFRFAEHNAVFIVDLVVPDRVLYAYLPDAKPKHWVESLEQIQKLKFEKVYMSHMRVDGNRNDVTFMQEYFKALYAAIDKELANNTPFFDIPYAVKLPQYAHLKNYNLWLPMNVWRILMEKSIGQ